MQVAGPLRAAPSRTSESQRAIYRPELDVLRFVAFLCVFLHHTLNVSAAGALMQNPFLGKVLPILQQMFGFGLPLFFFLSSYLITSLLEIEKRRTGTVHLGKFYIRRILRIWPLYFLYLGFAYLLGLVWKHVEIEPTRLLAMVLLSANWYSIFRGLGSSYMVVPLWSISVEEQFYLFWPTLARKFSIRTLRRFCCLLCLLSVAFTWLLGSRGISSTSIWLNSAVQTLFFASGALLALRIGIEQKVKSALHACIAISAGLVLWFVASSFSGITDRVHTPVAWRIALGYAVVAVGCALLLWGFLRLPHWTLPGPLVYFGRISYGLYVYHGFVIECSHTFFEPTIQSLRIPGGLLAVQLLVTVIIASISYRFLEKPFLKLKTSFEFVRTRAA